MSLAPSINLVLIVLVPLAMGWRRCTWPQRTLRRQGDAAMMVSQDAQRSLPLAQRAFSREPQKRVLLCAEMASERGFLKSVSEK